MSSFFLFVYRSVIGTVGCFTIYMLYYIYRINFNRRAIIIIIVVIVIIIIIIIIIIKTPLFISHNQ